MATVVSYSGSDVKVEDPQGNPVTEFVIYNGNVVAGAHTCTTCQGNGGWLDSDRNWITCSTCNGSGFTR